MTDNVALIRRYVESKIYGIENVTREPAARAELAVLRRGVGKKPGEDPKLWAIAFEDLPEALMGKGPEPSRAEYAVYTALTLYAQHQQGKSFKTESMNRKTVSLGIALRRLVDPMEDEGRVKRRFDAFATAGGIIELANHARGLIKLLGGNGIPLDYADFAADLYRYQYPASRDGVRLKWGRDFYRMRTDEEKTTEE